VFTFTLILPVLDIAIDSSLRNLDRHNIPYRQYPCLTPIACSKTHHISLYPTEFIVLAKGLVWPLQSYLSILKGWCEQRPTHLWCRSLTVHEIEPNVILYISPRTQAFSLHTSFYLHYFYVMLVPIAFHMLIFEGITDFFTYLCFLLCSCIL